MLTIAYLVFFAGESSTTFVGLFSWMLLDVVDKCIPPLL